MAELNSTRAGIQRLALSEQARGVTDWRREGGWETVALKDHQQREMEGKLQLHPLVSDVAGTGSGSLLNSVLSTFLRK